eukprot:TRINITY_DN2445_c0_g1_i1.p1 TRINITY_DN2445_c0_g1~~TRINITY_DN2445_c0_g1_i1.p1  ORF type:complete len:323 (-),score=57.96 TRINITY_DN2445_c0_g1_i1:25-993(-)
MALAALSAAGLCFNLFYLVLVAVGETKHRIPGLLPAFALSGHTILLLAFVIHPMIGYRRVFETHWMCQSQGAVIVFGAFVTAAYVLTLVFSLYNTVVRRADWMPSERLLHRTIFSATAVYAAALGLFGVFEDAALCCFFNPGHAYTFLFFSGPLLVVTLVGGYAWISVLQAMAKIQLSQQGATESSALIAQNGHEKPHTIRVLIRAATKHPRHVAMLAVIVFSVLTAAGCELAIALGSQNTPVYSVYICAIVAPAIFMPPLLLATNQIVLDVLERLSECWGEQQESQSRFRTRSTVLSALTGDDQPTIYANASSNSVYRTTP